MASDKIDCGKTIAILALFQVSRGRPLPGARHGKPAALPFDVGAANDDAVDLDRPAGPAASRAATSPPRQAVAVIT
jgi:plasmid replication initiation protein